MSSFEEVTITLSDGYPAYGRYWSPSITRGAVLYHHGIQSHCGWYECSPPRLMEAGFAVLQVDRRGSGRNHRDRGHADSADQLITDALTARDELARRSGHDDYHIVGVSWGGKLAVATYLQEPAGIRSLSLVTPGLFPQLGVSKSEMAKIGFAMLYEPHKRFDIPLNEAELFTVDPAWQTFFRTDELTLRACSAGFYLASRRMDKPISKLAQAAPVPIHLLLATDERIIDNEKTSQFIRDLHWPDCRFTTYQGARHSLEFELDPEIYFRDLVAFIEQVDGEASRRTGAESP